MKTVTRSMDWVPRVLKLLVLAYEVMHLQSMSRSQGWGRSGNDDLMALVVTIQGMNDNKWALSLGSMKKTEFCQGFCTSMHSPKAVKK